MVALADVRPGLAQQAAHSRQARAYTDWRDLIADTSVEVVHVVTPPNTHAEICIAAAARAKSAFCEKPLALTVEDADRMISVFRQSGTTLGINYVMRHHPIYRLLIELSDANLLGGIRRVGLNNGAQSMPDNHWFWNRSISGGILVEHGVHFFDVFRRIISDAEPRWTVDQRKRIEANVEYEAGAWGSFYHDFSLDKRVEGLNASLTFENGTAHVMGWIPQRLEITSLTGKHSDQWNTIARSFPGCRIELKDSDEVVSILFELPDRQLEYRRATVRGMLEVARAHRDPTIPPEVTPEDGRESLRLAISAQSIAHPPEGDEG